MTAQPQQQLQRARIVASVAATVIALASGSNYVYSAWAPQFAEKLRLSSTESNLVGLFGNLGMYSLGVPIGMLIDSRGPRPAVLVGSALLAAGYFPLHQAYDNGEGSVFWLCFCSYMSGLGGCTAFGAAVKTSALNWPEHRGTATAFPIAAFGLSAFFFSFVGSVFFPGEPGDFLMLLAVGTCGLTFAAFFFLRVCPQPQYHALPMTGGFDGLGADRPVPLQRTSSKTDKAMRDNLNDPHDSDLAPGASSSAYPDNAAGDLGRAGREEREGLMADPEAADGIMRAHKADSDAHQEVDIRGVALIKSLEFWQLFFIMAILGGIGIMTINNIGNNAKALWQKYDSDIDEKLLVSRQQMHVSIISVGSFIGRLSSGVGSDYLVKRLNASRAWCLVIATVGFFMAQFLALNIETPQFLVFVSILSGVAYGFLFGVFPSLMAQTFGIRGLSQNWGAITLAPVFSSNVFNLYYGRNFDSHSTKGSNGELECLDGLQCYKAAYWLTFLSCVVGLAASLNLIRHQRRHAMENYRSKGVEED